MLTLSSIHKAKFNQGGRNVSLKWCNHLDKKKIKPFQMDWTNLAATK
jgi:hypothetical protein